MNPFKENSLIRVNFPKYLLPAVEFEVRNLGYTPEFTNYSGLEIRGGMLDAIKLNLHLRCAHKVLYLLDEFQARNIDDLYKNEIILSRSSRSRLSFFLHFI